jgi:1,4-dihydroxy-2-naphthoate octaprenyltransferase
VANSNAQAGLLRDPQALLGPMRLPFLVLPPACVLLGIGTAVWTQGKINVWDAIIVFVGAVAAHISVNALNEYHDFRSGLDTRTRPTPFSGGSGTLPAKPEAARSALITGLATLALAVLIGVYFFFRWGPGILVLGGVGAIVIVTYTAWLTHNPVLCLIAPGFGFGTLMVMGADFCLTGRFGWTAFTASLVPFFLVSNLLLLNQFPDVEADRTVGRRHLPIVLGAKKASLVYGLFLLLTYVSIVAGVVLGALPLPSLLGLLALFLAVPAAIGAYRHAETVEKLVPIMGINVLVTVVTPILVAVGLLLA